MINSLPIAACIKLPFVNTTLCRILEDDRFWRPHFAALAQDRSFDLLLKTKTGGLNEQPFSMPGDEYINQRKRLQRGMEEVFTQGKGGTGYAKSLFFAFMGLGELLSLPSSPCLSHYSLQILEWCSSSCIVLLSLAMSAAEYRKWCLARQDFTVDKAMYTSHNGIYRDPRKAKPVVTFLFDMAARTAQLWQTWIREGSCPPDKFLDMVLPQYLGGCKLWILVHSIVLLLTPSAKIMIFSISSVHS